MRSSEGEAPASASLAASLSARRLHARRACSGCGPRDQSRMRVEALAQDRLELGALARARLVEVGQRGRGQEPQALPSAGSAESDSSASTPGQCSDLGDREGARLGEALEHLARRRLQRTMASVRADGRGAAAGTGVNVTRQSTLPRVSSRGREPRASRAPGRAAPRAMRVWNLEVAVVDASSAPPRGCRGALVRAAAAKPVMLEIIGRGRCENCRLYKARGSADNWRELYRKLPRPHAPAGEPAAARRLRAERLSHREAAFVGRVQHRLSRARRQGHAVRHQGIPALVAAAAHRRRSRCSSPTRPTCPSSATA